MKPFLLILCGLLLAAPLLVAQDIDPAIQQAITNAVPPAYAGWAALILLIIAGFFRFLTAKENGLSNAAAFLATLKGTNVPKKLQLLLAGFCMLSLSSCANDPGSKDELIKFGKRVALSIAESAVVVAQLELANQTQAWIDAKTAGDPVKAFLAQAAMLSAQQSLDAAAKALAKEKRKLDKQPVDVLPTADVKPRQNRLKPGLQYPDGPGCMQLADRIPVYGERVAFMLSTANIRN